MKYLIVDTSHKYLNIGLVEEERIVENYQVESHKSQSEKIVPTIMELFKKHSWSVDDLNGMVITKGPGSYTGVRIAMTVAKVLCTLKPISLYTVSTLQAYGGVLERVCVLIDARSNRAFCGVYDQGKAIIEDCVLPLEDIKRLVDENSYHCVGDTMLLGHKEVDMDIIGNIMALKDEWTLVDNVHTLTPTYLKEQEAYGK